MKKFLLLPLLVLSCFSSDIKPSKAIQNEKVVFNECPKLNVINPNQEEAKGLAQGLKSSVPILYEIYSDLLISINKTEEPIKYMSGDELKLLGTSLVWGYLVGTYYQEDIELKDSLKKQIFDSININEENWCNKKIILKELNK